MTGYLPAEKPTFYFIGVTTAKSSIMRVFPAWAKHLGLEANMRGIDFPLKAEPARYRAATTFLKSDSLSLGALVTTHKLDLFAACRDLFDEIDPHARLLEETSCLSKRAGRLISHAKDPVTSGRAVDSFLAPDHFARTGAEVFALGAGGSTIALTWHLMRARPGGDRPRRIVVCDVAQDRLAHIRAIHERMGGGLHVDYVLSTRLGDSDRVLGTLASGSLVVNATGLGKDAPGSPLSDAAVFPERAVVWELNYRGDLVFLDQARAQAAARGLQIEDGWRYFIHGWSEVIAEVFAVQVSISGPEFDVMSRIAAEATGMVRPQPA